MIMPGMCTCELHVVLLIFYIYPYSPTSSTTATPAKTHFAFGCFVLNCALKTKVGPRNSVL